MRQFGYDSNPRGSGQRRGFTLVELVVVIAIIVILVALSAPALGPILASNAESQVVNTLNGVLTTAQTRAQASGMPVAVRVERAYRTDELGRMIDANGNPVSQSGRQPVWLNHQRMRYVKFQATGYSQGFSRIEDSKVVDLPRGAWLAPGYVINSFDPKFNTDWLSANHEKSGGVFIPNPFDTFYIVFDVNGTVTVMPAENVVYFDPSQPDNNGNPSPVPPGAYNASNDYVYDTVRSLIVYDREKFNDLPPSPTDAREELLLRQSRPLFINRFLGVTVEGQSR